MGFPPLHSQKFAMFLGAHAWVIRKKIPVSVHYFITKYLKLHLTLLLKRLSKTDLYMLHLYNLLLIVG
jgi:hypothetical protein